LVRCHCPSSYLGRDPGNKGGRSTFPNVP
jgi:hypothetical protein